MQKTNLAKNILVGLCTLCCLIIVGYYFINQYFRSSFIRYKEFGIGLPINYSIHGIDVSHYQNDIDWAEIKQMKVKDVGIGFAFIKATEGINITDSYCKQNMIAAKKVGMARGAYHFFIPTQSGKAQALHFIQTVQLKKGDLPPVLDVEIAANVPANMLQQRVAEWLAVVENHYKTKPIIYTSASFYNKYLANTFDAYPLWVAHYLVKDKPQISRDWQFWQHNEAGHVTGINGYVDFNVFNGDSTAFAYMLLR